MSNVDAILQLAASYEDACLLFVKTARIRKLPNGKYRVLSQKGKNLGTSDSRSGARHRLRQVEFFKHKDKHSVEDGEVIDLTGAAEFTYSSIMRELRQKCSKEQVMDFLKIFKKIFDNSVKNKLQKPEKIALQDGLIKFNKLYKIKVNRKLIKSAAVSELGDPRLVGKYLSDIIRFTLTKINPEKRQHAIDGLKRKIYNLNENEISMKNLPASSALGQSITFVKTILFNHNPIYIRQVLNNLVRNL